MGALIFDLDGTLVDTVYAHVFAWQRALAEAGMPIDGWRIHRRIGMSGGLFTRAVARELGRALTDEEVEASRRGTVSSSASCCRSAARCPARVEPAAPSCARRGVAHGIATSAAGRRSTRRWRRSASRDETVVVARGDVARAKPEPDLFLACAARPRRRPEECYVVGDAVWDLLAARRARMLSDRAADAAATARTSSHAPAPTASTATRELRHSLDELGVVP